MKVSLLVVSTTMWAQLAMAASPEPMPCVDEICLGDGARSLGRIQWDDVSGASARPMTGRQRQKLDAIYKGRFDEIASSLAQGKFDQRVLRRLDRVEAACGGNGLTGQFTSAGGNPTRVTLSLLPAASGQQTWQVTAITRSFPSARNRRQQQEVQQQLDARYGRYDMHKRSPKPGEASYLYSWAGMPMLVLNLVTPPPSVMEARYALSPQCPKARATRID